MKISELNLSAATQKVLLQNDLGTTEALEGHTLDSLIELPGIGETRAKEIIDALTVAGLEEESKEDEGERTLVVEEDLVVYREEAISSENVVAGLVEAINTPDVFPPASVEESSKEDGELPVIPAYEQEEDGLKLSDIQVGQQFKFVEPHPQEVRGCLPGDVFERLMDQNHYSVTIRNLRTERSQPLATLNDTPVELVEQ